MLYTKKLLTITLIATLIFSGMTAIIFEIAYACGQ